MSTDPESHTRSPDAADMASSLTAGMRIPKVLRIFLGAALLCGCVGAGVGSGTPPIPAVSREVVVSILSACSGRSRAEFFRVSIPESGQLTYSGMQLTRQLGTKNVVATASQVEAISSAAKLFLAGGSRRGIRAEPGLETDDYCVEVREVGGGRTKVVRSMFLYDRRPEIVTLIDAVLLENRLVCPGRTYIKKLKLSTYCHDYPRPLMALVVWEAGTCSSYHTVDVYEDGTVYYNAQHFPEAEGRAGRSVLGESYYQLPPRDVDALVTMVRGFSTHEENELSHRLVTPRYMGTDPAQRSLLERELRARAGISWAEIPPDRVPCRRAAPSGSELYLRRDVVVPEPVEKR